MIDLFLNQLILNINAFENIIIVLWFFNYKNITISWKIFRPLIKSQIFMSISSEAKSDKLSKGKLLSGSFLIAGTMIGAGMLGMPMATARSGFIPGCLTTIGVWLFMLMTGILLLEVCLKMPKGSNFLSISEHFLGKFGKYFIGLMFVFLYYSLLVAYIAGGAPLFSELIYGRVSSSSTVYLIFSLVFGLIVFLGTKWVDRINIALSFSMYALFVFIMFISVNTISISNLSQHDFSKILISVPVLFGAFGYHNVIPSLCDYLERDRKVLILSIVFGTLISLTVYLVWQQAVLGSVSRESLQIAMKEGKTCISALQMVSVNSKLYLFGKYFAVSALATSLLGVSLSVVDFLKDGFSNYKIKISRTLLCFLVFAPCTFFAILKPDIFSSALGLAGGVGEAILNGIFPVVLVWVGFYNMNNLFDEKKYYFAKRYLSFLFLLGLMAIGIEILDLL